MKRIIFTTIIISFFGILGFLPVSAETEKDLESVRYILEYTKDVQSYSNVRIDFSTKEKKKAFVYDFVKLVQELDEKDEIGNFNKCKKFWEDYFRDENIFKEDTDLKKAQKSISDYFEKFEKKKTADIEQKFKKLEQIGENQRKDYALLLPNRVDNYTKLLRKIYLYLVPKNNLELNELNKLYTEIGTLFKPFKELDSSIREYICLWQSYYNIEDGDAYSQKEAASQEKHKKLVTIKGKAQKLNAFGISQKVNDIEVMIHDADKKLLYWKIHVKLDGFITDFENKLTFAHLYAVVGLIKNSGNIKWDTELANRIRLFKNIPPKENLTVKSLEDYLSTVKNRDDKVVKVLRSQLRKNLIEQYNQKMLDGGDSLNDVKKVKIFAQNYSELLKERSFWIKCISNLEKYYQAKEKNDYPAMLELYKGNSNIERTCKTVFDSWNLKTKEQVIEDFLDYYNNQASVVLGDRGNKKKADFLKFSKFHEQAKKYIGKSIKEEWKSRYSLLKLFFDAKDKETKTKAAATLCTIFSDLAKSYSIKKPEKVTTKSSVLPESSLKPGELKRRQTWDKWQKKFKKEYKKIKKFLNRRMRRNDVQNMNKLRNFLGTYKNEDNPYTEEDNEIIGEVQAKLKELEQKTNVNTERSGLVQQKRIGSPEEDFKKLKDMWKEVEKLKMERKIVAYIRSKKAPLNASGNYARERLEKIFGWHNKWSDLKSKYDELEALAMIGRMQTFADNPDKQNEVYKHLLKRMDALNLQSINLLSPLYTDFTVEKVNDTINNNTLYLALHRAFKNKTSLFRANEIQKSFNNKNPYTKNVENILDFTTEEKLLYSIDSALKYNLLTLEQQIQAHYMLGKIHKWHDRREVVPLCYHFGKISQLLQENNIAIGDIANFKIDQKEVNWCYYCKSVKGEQSARDIFEGKYKNVDINRLLQGCPPGEESEPPEDDIESEGPGAGGQMDIISFLDKMFSFVQTSKPDPTWGTMANELLDSSLGGYQFQKVVKKYKSKIPEKYDALMNLFFHKLYRKMPGWERAAKEIIEQGRLNWPPNVRIKIRDILNTAKRIF